MNDTVYKYKISEIFGPTIQGEGLHAGQPCVFVRFSGCNLWKTKGVPSVTCPWCDTPQLFDVDPNTQDEIIRRLDAINSPSWHGLVISGGEPLLQLDQPLLDALALRYKWIDIETNGTVTPKFTRKPDNVFLSVSPKTNRMLVKPDWLKVLVPDKLGLLDALMYSHEVPVYLQPVDPSGKGEIDSEDYKRNVRSAVHIAMTRGCRVSLQLHKYLGVK